jgi:hypothetical protein
MAPAQQEILASRAFELKLIEAMSLVLLLG